MKTILILIMLLLLSGCAQWAHKTKSQAEFDQDRYDCSIFADERTVRQSSPTGWYVFQDYVNQCLREHGWYDSLSKTDSED